MLRGEAGQREVGVALGCESVVCGVFPEWIVTHRLVKLKGVC